MFDLNILAEESAGFSGAEIEQVIVSALYAVETKELKTMDLQKAIKATKPLSIIMDKQIAELRDWAETRTVPAN